VFDISLFKNARWRRTVYVSGISELLLFKQLGNFTELQCYKQRTVNRIT